MSREQPSTGTHVGTDTGMVTMLDVQKHFGDHHVLKDISLTIAPREVVVDRKSVV